MPPTSDRSAYLDVARGVSAQLVVVGHALNLAFAGTMMEPTASGLWGPRSGVFYVAELGVVVFFVLSGFLVTLTTRRKLTRPTYGLREYVVERAVRIFVPFVPALALIVAADSVLLRSGSEFVHVDLRPGTVVSNLAMLQGNMVTARLASATDADLLRFKVGSADPFWSVALEWWLYLAFGLVALAVLRKRALGVLSWLVLIFATLTFLERAGLVVAWMVGMGYAWSDARLVTLGRATHLGIAVAGLAVAATLLSAGTSPYHWLVAGALAVALLSGYHVARHAARSAPSAVLRSAAFVADYSYSLYLVHFSLMIYLLARGPELGGWSTFVSLVLLANVAGAGFWWLFERHHVAVRRFVMARVDRRPLVPPPDPVVPTLVPDAS